MNNIKLMTFQEELKANKGKKIDDPFTRRSTKPCMKFRAKPNSGSESTNAPEVEDLSKNDIEPNDTKASVINTLHFLI